MPALLISTVTGPSAASAASLAFAMEALLLTSISTAAARPPLALISSSSALSLPTCRAASATAAPCAASTRANCRPRPWLAPVMRMVSALMSNRSDMLVSSPDLFQLIDTDDLKHGKPHLITGRTLQLQRPSHEQLRSRHLLRTGDRRLQRLQYRAVAQRHHHPRLPAGHAARNPR